MGRRKDYRAAAQRAALRPLWRGFSLQYLFVCGLFAHALALAVFLHYRSTGVSPYRYVTRGVEELDRDSSPARHVARFVRAVVLDSGLLADPAAAAVPLNEEYPLPRWRGAGASLLRRDTAPRYTGSGDPVPTTDDNLWLLARVPATRPVRVDSVAALRAAVEGASPGVEIVLAPGTYAVDAPLRLAASGSADQPLVLRASAPGEVVLELNQGASIVLTGNYWALTDLIVRGPCDARAACAAAFRHDGAQAFTGRNLFVSGFGGLVQVVDVSAAEAGIGGLFDGVTLLGGDVPLSASGWRFEAMRTVRIPAAGRGLVVLCADSSTGAGCDTDDLSRALRLVDAGGIVLLRSGVHEHAVVIDKADLHLLAEPGAVLAGASTQGKGALVTNADLLIEGLECMDIRVPDGNGACVRQQQGNLTLRGVHFHHAQMGVLTGHAGGEIKIFDSYIHDSGSDGTGALGHNVYVNSGSLLFSRSWSVGARNGGHEIKSRGSTTVIEDSLVASFDARDSRLVDIPDGGDLEILGSVLGEGPASENWDLIGYGLELPEGGSSHRSNTIRIHGNTIYGDRRGGAKTLHAEHAASIRVRGNVLIGSLSSPGGENVFYNSRRAAGVAAYPQLPPQTF